MRVKLLKMKSTEINAIKCLRYAEPSLDPVSAKAICDRLPFELEVRSVTTREALANEFIFESLDGVYHVRIIRREGVVDKEAWLASLCIPEAHVDEMSDPPCAHGWLALSILAERMRRMGLLD